MSEKKQKPKPKPYRVPHGLYQRFANYEESNLFALETISAQLDHLIEKIQTPAQYTVGVDTSAGVDTVCLCHKNEEGVIVVDRIISDKWGTPTNYPITDGNEPK